MAITFRHDAAGVVPPSNSSTRKYGQSLVMQQQQQKYAAQQAGYDRMFDAYKMENQNQFQQQRDWQQRDFVLNRDRDQAKLQQQQMDAARQQQFMDEARKASSAMIMDDIQQGNYDPATARKLQQNLVAESEALGNPQLDATQRAEALQKIRAERALLSANRMEKPPAPTAQDQFDQQIVTRNGVDYVQNPRGGWEPLQQPKPSKEELQQQQQAEQMRPMSAQEYYGQNEDKFQKDLDSKMKEMQSEYDNDPSKPKPTPEAAWAKMQKDYEFRQQALGKPQYGEPTLAPEAPKPFGQAMGEALDNYNNNQTPENKKAWDDLRSQSKTLSALEQEAMKHPRDSDEWKAAWKKYRDERDRIIKEETPVQSQAPEMRSIIEDPNDLFGPPAQQSIPSSPPAPAPAFPAAPTSSVPVAPAPAPSQNAWADVAKPAQAASTPTPAAPPVQSPSKPAANSPKSAAQVPKAPDFNALSSSAKNKTDRAVIDGMKGIYSQQSPEVQSAIGVYLNPNSSDPEFADALKTLIANGINPQNMQPPMKGHWDAMKDTNKALSGVR